VTHATFRQLGLLPSSDDGTVISTNYFHPIDSVRTTEYGYTDFNDECQQQKGEKTRS